VLFVAVSSPFILNATILHHLSKYEDPVSRDLKRSIYVDNVATSVPDVNNLIDYYINSRHLFAEGGFNLRSWSTNCDVVDEMCKADNVFESKRPVSVLGISWHPKTDNLSLSPKQIAEPNTCVITNREIVSEASKLFDPLGFITPSTIRAKMLIQDLWKAKIDWDEPVTPEQRVIWTEISKDLIHCNNAFSISRKLTDLNIDDSATIHVFADASSKGYGAVAYLQVGTNVSFLMSRSRITPIKELTIPQLELMAAEIAANLLTFILNSLTITCDYEMWSDSKIVLYWILSDNLATKSRFVNNRTRNVKRLSDPKKWHHCPGVENPADLITRGAFYSELEKNPVWWHGPAWLPDPDKWPSDSVDIAMCCYSSTIFL